MHEVQQQHAAAVAVARTAAAADLVSTMLEAHGLRAWTEAYAGVYPSVEWVEGHRVQVADDDRAAALEVLAALDHHDAARLDPGDTAAPEASGPGDP
jgi:hypothetical protein